MKDFLNLKCNGYVRPQAGITCEIFFVCLGEKCNRAILLVGEKIQKQKDKRPCSDVICNYSNQA